MRAYSFVSDFHPVSPAFSFKSFKDTELVQTSKAMRPDTDAGIHATLLPFLIVSHEQGHAHPNTFKAGRCC